VALGNLDHKDDSQTAIAPVVGNTVVLAGMTAHLGLVDVQELVCNTPVTFAWNQTDIAASGDGQVPQPSFPGVALTRSPVAAPSLQLPRKKTVSATPASAPAPASPHGVIPHHNTTLISNEIFVGGLCPDLRKKDLQKYFCQYGQIAGINVKENIVNKRFIGRGFGFVTFQDKRVAKHVVFLKHHQIQDRVVEATAARGKEELEAMMIRTVIEILVLAPKGSMRVGCLAAQVYAKYKGGKEAFKYRFEKITELLEKTMHDKVRLCQDVDSECIFFQSVKLVRADLRADIESRRVLRLAKRDIVETTLTGGKKARN